MNVDVLMAPPARKAGRDQSVIDFGGRWKREFVSPFRKAPEPRSAENISSRVGS